eukprot:950821-Rhodomonas_salina.1
MILEPPGPGPAAALLQVPVARASAFPSKVQSRERTTCNIAREADCDSEQPTHHDSGCPG